MAVTVGDLIARLGLDSSEFQRGLRMAGRDMEQLGRRMRRIGAGLTAAVTVPLVGVGGAAIKMAADAVESENLFEVAMGNMAGAAREFSERLRRDLGLNAFEVRRQIGVFNQMFTAMGIGERQAFELASGLTELTQDMASFFNLRPEEAFQKLQSGIVGEIEPLRRLGILVDENTIKSVALREGIVRQGEEMTQQQKVIARYVAILDQTANAQGDLARTMDSPTNRLRRLRAEMGQAAIELGIALLPAFNELLAVGLKIARALGRVARAFQELPSPVRTTAIAVAVLAAAIGPLLIVAGQLAIAITALGPVLLGIGGPIALAVAAFASLGAAAIAVLNNIEFVKQQILLALAALTNTANNVVQGLAAMPGTIGAAARAIAPAFDELNTKMLNAANNATVAYNDLVQEMADKLKPATEETGTAATIAGTQMVTAANAAKGSMQELEEQIRRTREELIALGDAIVVGAPANFGRARGAIGELERVERDFERFRRSPLPAPPAIPIPPGGAEEATDDLRDSLFDSMSELQRDVNMLAVGIGQQIVFGIIDGVNDVKSFLKNILKSIISAAVSAGLRAALGVASPSKLAREFGRFTGMGFALGIKDMQQVVRSAAFGLGSTVKQTMAAFQPSPVTAVTPGLTGAGVAAVGAGSAAGGNLTINVPSPPAVFTPEAQAVNAWWQRVTMETARALGVRGFRFPT